MTFKDRKIIVTLQALLILLLLSVPVAGTCSDSASGKQVTVPQVESAPGYKYRIGPEDVLEISVWHNDDLSKTVTVRPDGVISLPLIGDIQAAGLTPDELRANLVKQLKEFQNSVVVSVVVAEVNSLKIFILGEIVKPGSYTLKRRTSVLQAIAMAGGFTQFASKNKLVLIREENAANKGKSKIPIRFNDLVKVGTKQNNKYLLVSGDTIFVP